MTIIPEAAAADLPAVLVRPPWAARAPRTPPIVIAGLQPPDIPDRIDWLPAERQAAQRTRYDGEDEAKTPERDRRLLATLDEPTPHGHGFWILFHLSDAAALDVWLHRPLTTWWYVTADDLRRLLLRFGLDGLPPFLALATSKLALAVEVVSPVCSLKLAGPMAEALSRLKKVRPIAAAWLERFPHEAALGLIPAAVGAPGPPREYAEQALRHLAARGHRDAVRAASREYGAAVAAAIDAALEDDAAIISPARLPKMPPFWDPASLPRLLLRGRQQAIPLSAIETIGVMLALSTLERPYPGLAAVKEACDPASLADFAWALFQQFGDAGGPPTASWAFEALGHFGNDDIARRITPLVRAWPSGGAVARAMIGVEILARIGSDVALMHLHGIAHKVKSRPLQQRAISTLEAVAAARGLDSDALADRLVPDLDLDESGTRTLDFGARRFQVAFDEQLTPFVRDEAGTRLTTLPKPGRADDPARSAEAVATWKAIKAAARTIADVQRARLERAMCHRRRWTTAEFVVLFATHPLMRHLARRLVWATYDTDGVVDDSFRVAEDGSYASRDDELYTLPADARLGIAHPLELTDDLRSAWSARFAEYQILQPFLQLGRRCFTRPAEASALLALTIVDGHVVAFGNVLALERRGWRRGTARGGHIVEMIKTLPVDGYEARLPLHPGLYAPALPESPAQKLGAVTLQRTDSVTAEDRLSPGSIDPVTYSELVGDLHSLRA